MFRKRLTTALAALDLVSLLQGGVAWWAVDVATQNVQRGRVASDLLAAFLELSATKHRLRTWLSQALLDAALLDAGADTLQRERLQAEMKATLARLEALAMVAAQADGVLVVAIPEHQQRRDAFSILRRSVEDLS